MEIPGGFAAYTAGDPDGTRTDGPQAAHVIGQPTVPPTIRLDSSAAPAM